jgi:protein phosphatase
MELPEINPPQDPYKLRQIIKRGLINLKFQEKALNVVDRLVTLPDRGKVIVIGDIHGDLNSLKTILKLTDFINREKENEVYLILLGDYIDRGSKQIEVVLTLLNLLERYPTKIIPLRGNHEGPRNLRPAPHDFPQQLRYYYGELAATLYNDFHMLFEQLYLAAYIKNQVLLVHGGIPIQLQSLKEFQHLERKNMVELLWNDPAPISGSIPNPRGIGKLFGHDITDRFLDNIKANILIRGHQYFSKGYKIEGRVVTIFSCKLPHYGNNKAAFINLDLGKPVNKDTIKWFVETF